MAEKTKKTVEVATDHPMEGILNIEQGTTMIEQTQSSTQLVQHEDYDNKDVELEDQFQEVYDAAFDAFEAQNGEAELVEGKYKARNAEVAANFLTTALNAAKEKADMKKHKDKLSASSGGAQTVNNNIIIDRNELLKALLGEEKDVTPDPTDTPIEGQLDN